MVIVSVLFMWTHDLLGGAEWKDYESENDIMFQLENFLTRTSTIFGGQIIDKYSKLMLIQDLIIDLIVKVFKYSNLHHRSLTISADMYI